jgi:hypothetical protein
MTKVSNEKKNLSRLAGEFLVASRLTQRGFMISLQWGSTVSYDVLVFDKKGKVAFLEVKASASYPRRWVLQKKYAQPENDPIPLASRFVCCVDLAVPQGEPVVYIFPAGVVAAGLRYYFNSRFPQSDSYHLSLDFKPQGRTKDALVQTVGEHINADKYREAYEILNVDHLLV